MNQNNRNPIKTIIGIISMVIVVAVIILSFVYRNVIEKYAAVSYLGVFVACIASTSTILLPAPGIIVVLRYAQIFNPVVIIIIGGIGTAIGEMIGYLFGWSGKELFRINTSKRLFSWFTKHPYTMVFVFSVIPLPIFDIVGICAGATKMNPVRFFSICAIGKTIKMLLFVLLFNYVMPHIPLLQDLASLIGQ